MTRFANTSKTKDKYGSMSRATYNALKYEIKKMPKQEVKTLPSELQDWIFALRPELQAEEEIGKELAVEKNLKTKRQEAVSPPIHKEKSEEMRKSSSEQVPSQLASGQPGRRRLTLDAPVVDGLREKPSPRKRRHLVKAVDPRMTWCGHSLDGRIHLFWTDKIELCTCWHCRRWYKYAATGIWDD